MRLSYAVSEGICRVSANFSSISLLVLLLHAQKYAKWYLRRVYNCYGCFVGLQRITCLYLFSEIHLGLFISV